MSGHAGDATPLANESALVRDAGGAPLLRCPRDWCGLPLDLLVIPGEAERGEHYAPAPMILVARSGLGRRWYRSGAVKRELYTCPQMIEVYAQGYRIDHGRWKGVAGQCVSISFPEAEVSRVLHDAGDRFDFVTRHQVFDDRVSRLAFELADEVQQGSAHGRLYAEGLSLALIGALSTHLAARDTGLGSSVRRLSRNQRERVRALIDAGLGGDLRIERMAAHLDMSPFQFVRRFKATFDVSPHRFVLKQRIEAATAALRATPDRPIADIALAFGFASQAHFTEAFRRHTGQTPARARLS